MPVPTIVSEPCKTVYTLAAGLQPIPSTVAITRCPWKTVTVVRSPYSPELMCH